MRLTVLLATLPNRKRPYLDKVKSMIPEWAEILIDDSVGNLGEKRQMMLEKANGDYVAVLDDDDEPSDNYFDEIKKGIDKDVDAICLGVDMYSNGVFKYTRRYGLLNPYKGDSDISVGHFCPVKRELALKSGYRSMGWGEEIDHIIGLQEHLSSVYYVEPVTLKQNYFNIPKEYDKYPTIRDFKPRQVKATNKIF